MQIVEQAMPEAIGMISKALCLLPFHRPHLQVAVEACHCELCTLAPASPPSSLNILTLVRENSLFFPFSSFVWFVWGMLVTQLHVRGYTYIQNISKIRFLNSFAPFGCTVAGMLGFVL